MSHRDAEITDITVILTKAYEEKLAEAVDLLKGVGMEVTRADDDASVVEGSIESSKLAALEHLPCIAYVRKVMTYTADYPTGDPRDKDGADAACPDELPSESMRKFGKRYP